ncbi:MAG: hypothetical protein H6706_05055 [Myxococcales bacterium]|nr:hypothetical protein [Myxococcales bacterium]
MRDDMDELLVERPRWGSGHPNWPARRRRARERVAVGQGTWDDLPLREAPAPRGERHWPEENLNPLMRFLRSRCGRSWDAVYGELRTGLDVRSPIQLHIFEHLWQFVARYVELRPEGVWRLPEGIRPGYLMRADGRSFFVHPRSGRLLAVPRRRVHPPPPSRDHHRGPDGALYARHEGVWWRVEVARLPQQVPPLRLFDVVLQATATPENAATRVALYGAPGLYGTSRVPLNRAALRAAGLWRR